MLKKIIILFFCLINLSFCISSFGQNKPKKVRIRPVQVPSVETIYDNIDYVYDIKTIEFFNTKKEQSFPTLNLGSDDQLILKFDDLRTGSKNIYYTFIHCNGDWEPTNITQLDYLDGFTFDRINQYRNAANTYQKYIHYEIKFPNSAIAMPKLSGNYLLKVYEDGDESRLLFTRRFYVLNIKMSLNIEVIPSNFNALRLSNQKINFTVSSPGILIQNPYQDIRIQILQNRRYDLAKWTRRPVFIKNDLLIYNDINSNDFAGGSEFTFFDIRSFRLKSQKVYQLTRDSLFQVSLFADVVTPKTEGYTFTFDENGKFFIRNQDGLVANPDADYAVVDFALKAEQPYTTGQVYVVGLFNQYQKNEINRMIYDAETKQYTLKMLLKQGVYDYSYSIADATGKLIDNNILNGSYFDTDNDYQILVYYRQPGLRFEELVAFSEFNSSKTQRVRE